MLHVERVCIRTYTLYVVLYLLSCSASNNLYYYLLSSPVAVPRVCVCVCVYLFTYACKGVFNPNTLFAPNSTEGLHFSAFHYTIDYSITIYTYIIIHTGTNTSIKYNNTLYSYLYVWL